MKKTLSVLLSVLLILSCMAPAAMAVGATYTVTFIQPSDRFEGQYTFVKSENGATVFEEDPDGVYVLYNGLYVRMEDIMEKYRPQDPIWYSPVSYEPVVIVDEGEIFTFKVYTSDIYNPTTAVVEINGQVVEANANGEYAIVVTGNTVVRVVESDASGDLLQKNHFNVKLPSGEGFNVKTLQGENYSVVYYGDSFYFRIKLASGYSAAGMSVSVSRGNDILGDYLGDDLDMLGNIMGINEPLTSYGVDSEGCRLYKIENVTSDCKVIVSGVRSEGFAKILSIIKRVLGMILQALGFTIPGIDLVNSYNVVIDNQAEGVSYKVLTSSSEAVNPLYFSVMSGEGVTIAVSKITSGDDDVTVTWDPGNPDGTYTTKWISAYDYENSRTYYTAIFNIDSVTSDTVITIS